MTESTSPPPEQERRRYTSVIVLLLVAALLGMSVSFAGGMLLYNKVLLDVAVAQMISVGILLGVLARFFERHRPPAAHIEPAIVVTADPGANAPGGEASLASEEAPAATGARRDPWIVKLRPWREMREQAIPQLLKAGHPRVICMVTGVAGALALALDLGRIDYVILPPVILEYAGIGIATVAAILSAVVARYLLNLDTAELPETRALGRAARVMCWLFCIAALSTVAEVFDQRPVIHVLHFAVVAILAAVTYALITTARSSPEAVEIFPVDLAPFAVLGSRPNLFASILDAGERQLGIDLRSTWALTVVRRTLEPLAICLLLLAWLSTSLTVVGLEEVGLVERTGVPVAGVPLEPGLHVHWPWPVDKVFRIPVKRVESLEIGHGGVESPGPENVLWAVAHAPNEFSLLLGNGRDLITVDAAVQYRVTDPHAWRYNCQNPAAALAALAYRAVMRNTVNRTLADALSENVAKLTGDMRSAVQRGADSLGLGVTVLDFTVGGMHPPVEVAPAYQAVVTAEIHKVTAVISANAYRNQVLPAAETYALVGSNAARAEGADALGRAAGEAWAFRTLEAQYHAAPEDYRFRRRLEALETGLMSRPFTVVDARYMRDGGELWTIP
jgi:regulator of protease activity HflC (stomatin/prohibitin superfamily)